MNYSIKDLEQLSGIKAHTLRIWEQRYEVLKPKRTDTNIRYYDDDDLKLVLNIALLNEHGYKISKIADMSWDDMRREVLNVTEKHQSNSEQIQALTISMIDLDEERFEKIMSTNFLHQGFENTMISIVFPFLQRIGVLWQTGAITPAHEHFISNLIRQKIIVAIDGLVAKYTASSPKFMLFLPEGELHEIGLLFTNYLIRVRGGRVVYLGQSLPFSDLCETYRIYRPSYLFSIITTTPAAEIQSYVDNLSKNFFESTIILSGFQVITQDLDLPENVLIAYNIADLPLLLSKLENRINVV
ncbi:DNA-binding transcriptional regulator, MerR family [Flexibacter flexilis DSM 6793]|uniref:DNA-binding transcriptional regulator, MerR family n=1 Tax=Flexibacter flexilis DSM 6793 TaxID=927664 RepID=A0A1I1FYS4_9BACT|nr:MerR family transcriptional regulator [Flexibacter flexilis]SFC02758.1 DNA-binding transcriptional regulator, MerR family [Flexibacter flexilis DSM 6793]